MRSWQIFSEFDVLTNETTLKTYIKSVPPDGRMVNRALYAQSSSLYGGYKRLPFEVGSAIIVISASVDNSYYLFGYKETQHTMARHTDTVII